MYVTQFHLILRNSKENILLKISLMHLQNLMYLACKFDDFLFIYVTLFVLPCVF